MSIRPNFLNVFSTALANLLLADIAHAQLTLTPFGFDKLLRLFRVLGFFQVHDGDVRAFAGEDQRHRSPIPLSPPVIDRATLPSNFPLPR